MAENQEKHIPGYTLQQLIAAGGMAEVYAAVQHSLGRRVAVKIMKITEDRSLAERFLREARLVATLSHPHIVHIYDVGRCNDGCPYLSMELLPGGDLAQRIRQGQLGEANIRRIMREIAEGLSVVHASGIIHRDIKPANILFRSNGDAVVSDFGIAKASDLHGELTQAGTVVGSPAYSSPEQINAMVLDARSDLYSLGVVLVEMLLGKNPFRGADYTGTVVNQVQMPAPTLPAAQAHWQPLVNSLLAKDCNSRPVDAGVVLAEIAALPEITAKGAAIDAATDRGDDTAIRSAPTSVPVKTMPRWALPLAAAVGLSILVGWGWHHHRQQQQIADWLSLGDERLTVDQLDNPAGDNATYFFRQVQTLDPHNLRADEGLTRVAARFAALGERARDDGDYELAMNDASRGIAIRPDDPELTKLVQELQAEQVGNGRRHRGLQGLLNNLFGH